MKVVVTGAAGALGQAVADGFCDAGALAGLIDRIEGPARSGAAWFLVNDLADAGAAREALGRAVGWLGGMDALVHLVGAFDWMEVTNSCMEDWRALFAVNVESTVATVQAALPHLADGGAIILVGAVSAQPAGAGMAPYAVAKSGVARLTEALAEELTSRRIRTNCILPGIIDTPRNRVAMPDADFSDWTSPSAIADVIHFLATPAARAVNGASIMVSNGV